MSNFLPTGMSKFISQLMIEAIIIVIEGILLINYVATAWPVAFPIENVVPLSYDLMASLSQIISCWLK